MKNGKKSNNNNNLYIFIEKKLYFVRKHIRIFIFSLFTYSVVL